MLQGFFNYDNDIWRFVGRLADIMVLNLLWIVCSLPIVTFGISTTALYYCTLKIVKDEDDGNFRMFFRSFKRNWKEGLIIWLILLPVLGILILDHRFFTVLFQNHAVFRDVHSPPSLYFGNSGPGLRIDSSGFLFTETCSDVCSRLLYFGISAAGLDEFRFF